MRALFLASLVILTGCTQRNSYGDCVGLDDKKDPKLEYKLSIWNIAMGILFMELLIPPIVVVADELECPVGPVKP